MVVNKLPEEELTLRAFGWDEGTAGAFEAHAAGGLIPGRVVVEDRGRFLVQTAGNEISAVVSGRFRFAAGGDRAAYPAVGDWVALDRQDETGSAGVIHAVLPRRSAIVRRAPGRRSDSQVLAANVDIGFVVSSMNREFNTRRLERYVAVLWESGAHPVLVLSKSDLAESADAFRRRAEEVASGVDVIVSSSHDRTGLDEIRQYLVGGKTAVLVGSSGVGKSSLVNALAGRELEPVSEIRLDDDRGRHTTRRRHLVRLPDGGLILDTPGMREIALADADGLPASFADIEELAGGCRFTDCRHETEPGCAVRAAIADERLDPDRLAAWQTLEREAVYAERRTDALARIEERRRWKAVHRSVAKHMQRKYGETWR